LGITFCVVGRLDVCTLASGCGDVMQE
jgi:hypothetical protein